MAAAFATALGELAAAAPEEVTANTKVLTPNVAFEDDLALNTSKAIEASSNTPSFCRDPDSPSNTDGNIETERTTKDDLTELTRQLVQQLGELEARCIVTGDKNTETMVNALKHLGINVAATVASRNQTAKTPAFVDPLKPVCDLGHEASEQLEGRPSHKVATELQHLLAVEKEKMKAESRRADFWVQRAEALNHELSRLRQEVRESENSATALKLRGLISGGEAETHEEQQLVEWLHHTEERANEAEKERDHAIQQLSVVEKELIEKLTRDTSDLRAKLDTATKQLEETRNQLEDAKASAKERERQFADERATFWEELELERSRVKQTEAPPATDPEVLEVDLGPSAMSGDTGGSRECAQAFGDHDRVVFVGVSPENLSVSGSGTRQSLTPSTAPPNSTDPGVRHWPSYRQVAVPPESMSVSGTSQSLTPSAAPPNLADSGTPRAVAKSPRLKLPVQKLALGQSLTSSLSTTATAHTVGSIEVPARSVGSVEVPGALVEALGRSVEVPIQWLQSHEVPCLRRHNADRTKSSGSYTVPPCPPEVVPPSVVSPRVPARSSEPWAILKHLAVQSATHPMHSNDASQRSPSARSPIRSPRPVDGSAQRVRSPGAAGTYANHFIGSESKSSASQTSRSVEVPVQRVSAQVVPPGSRQVARTGGSISAPYHPVASVVAQTPRAGDCRSPNTQIPPTVIATPSSARLVQRPGSIGLPMTGASRRMSAGMSPVRAMPGHSELPQ